MKQTQRLEKWFLREAGPEDTAELLATCRLCREEGWMPNDGAEQVQEVLLREKRIGEEVLLGHTEGAQWIAERDWVYACDFQCAPEISGYLRFGGVDTIAQIWLNGRKIAENDDMYVPLCVPVDGMLRGENRLVVRFESPLRAVQERLERIPEDRRRLMDRISVIRKCTLDFGDFGNVRLTNVGLFEPVTFVAPDQCELSFTDVETTLNDRLNEARLSVTPHVRGVVAPAVRARLTLLDPDGAQVACAAAAPESTAETV